MTSNLDRCYIQEIRRSWSYSMTLDVVKSGNDVIKSYVINLWRHRWSKWCHMRFFWKFALNLVIVPSFVQNGWPSVIFERGGPKGPPSDVGAQKEPGPDRVKTPNIVVVFSNSWSNRRHLSKDRWKMYEPTENGLQMVKKDRAKTKDVSVRFDIPSRRTYYSNTKSIKEIHE